jgi:hypothetical protein
LDAVQFAINAKVAMNQIYDLITRSLKLKNTDDLYFDLMLYARETMAEFDNFITDSRYQQLTRAYYTYEYRLQYIKDNDQNLFSNFIKKHPGIEHQAGVPKGGTYIMLVNGDGVTVDKPSRNYAVSQVRELQNFKVERAKLQLKRAKTVQDDLVLKRLDSQILQLETVQHELSTAVPVEKYMLEGYQVMADFTLPYLCCCDCECTDIPAPTTAAELNLPNLATPFYAQYSLGDYAFGKPVTFAAQSSPPSSRIINIEPSLQYDRRFAISQVHVYLVDKNGTKITGGRIVEDQQFRDVSMPTYNSPNDPTNTTQYGTVTVRTYTNGQAPQMFYAPVADFIGVDSWYYMFEIQDAAGNVQARSTMSKVTMDVSA